MSNVLLEGYMIETTVDISGLEEARRIHTRFLKGGVRCPEAQGDASFHNRLIQQKGFVLETLRTGKRTARAMSLVTKWKLNHEGLLSEIRQGTIDPTLVGDIAWQERWIKYYGYLLGQLEVNR